VVHNRLRAIKERVTADLHRGLILVAIDQSGHQSGITAGRMAPQ
jgi:hypothetical protein